ncbi:conserved hypothetical protein [Frankia canadensis]|uniref:MinD-like ATPase involved in chromosome partitioning or flagellar assembly n=1 Tax=Frankia canadensis TaxID=1836972 RepID=A0A2I2KW49_9ACTN|nr:chromosome partitioning protein [Frankia canadensis]SNQ49878.1 conserved hypothetical protein [Frankia canadensis]SOU57168.1 conserved hypothetical protein [Frankia canadensis]
MSGLVAVGAVKGSPGVTTTALGLAAGWPMRPGGAPVVAVEADPSGGDVLGWYELPGSIGLVSWAAQARSGQLGLSGHVQRLPGGVEVVAAPVEATAARGAVEVLTGTGAIRAAADTVTVVADVGRVDPWSAAAPVVAVCDLLVILARPVPVELARVVGREADLTAAGRRECVLLLVGEPAWPLDRVAESVGLPVAGVLPEDPRGAGLIAGRPGGRRAPGPLARAYGLVARGLAEQLADRRVPLPPLPAVPDALALPRGTTGASAGRTAAVLVPGASSPEAQTQEGSGWVPSTTVRHGRGERR